MRLESKKPRSRFQLKFRPESLQPWGQALAPTSLEAPFLAKGHTSFQSDFMRPVSLGVMVVCLFVTLAQMVRRYFSSEKTSARTSKYKRSSKKTTRSFEGGLAPWDQVASIDDIPVKLKQADLSKFPPAQASKDGPSNMEDFDAVYPPDNEDGEGGIWIEEASGDSLPSYPSLLPSFAAYVATLALVGFVFMVLVVGKFATVMSDMLPWLILPMSVLVCLVTFVCHFLHVRRVTLEPAPASASPGGWPLSHVVVLISRRTPLENLERSFEAVAAQTGTSLRPQVVLAAEAGDIQQDEALLALRKLAGKKVSRVQLLRHSLTELEMQRVPLLRSSLALEIFEQVVRDGGLDPFHVMVTFIDADSIMSPTYLANVEGHFHARPDGQRAIFSAALNTYRSLVESDVCSQMYEIMRCHSSVFFNPLTQYAPQANFSVTLGFAAELNLWACETPTDVRAAGRALEHCGTEPVEACIFSNPAQSFAERYESAKQQQMAVLEGAWGAALLRSMPSQLRRRWSMFKAAVMREASLFACAVNFCSFVAQIIAFCFGLLYWDTLTWHVKLCSWALFGANAWRWTCFWVAEGLYWRRCMSASPIAGLSFGRWVFLVVCSPALWLAAEFVFVIVPTLHCLVLAALGGSTQLRSVSSPCSDARRDSQ